MQSHHVLSQIHLAIWKWATQGYIKKLPIYFQQARVGDNFLVFFQSPSDQTKIIVKKKSSTHLCKQKYGNVKPSFFLILLSLLMPSDHYHCYHLPKGTQWYHLYLVYFSPADFFMFFLCMISNTGLWGRQTEVDIFQTAWNQIKARDRWLLSYTWVKIKEKTTWSV